MELVEVRARTVELAEQAAMEELGVSDRQRVEWEILQEPARGFLGVGRQDAIVRAKRKPSKRRRSRGRKSGGAKGRSRGSGKRPPKKQEAQTPKKAPRSQQGRKPKAGKSSKPSAESTVEEQAEVADGFLAGLVKAIEMPAEVKTRSEEDLVVAEIEGEEAETLVGKHGSGIEALHTITKSVIKRKTSGGARLRLDVAGYGRRRREALAIYATGLVEQVQSEGGELMLEPMNAADRKVIHDTVGQHDNVRSFSEGDTPHRYVVLAYVE